MVWVRNTKVHASICRQLAMHMQLCCPSQQQALLWIHQHRLLSSHAKGRCIKQVRRGV